MAILLQDLRYAVRTLLKSPGFTAVAVLTLALGIGAATVIYSVVEGVLLRPLPYPSPEQVMRVFQIGPHGGRMNVSDPNFRDLHEQNRSFQALAQFGRGGMESILAGSEPLRVQTSAVSRDFFEALGVRPIVGRTFSPEEQQEGGPPAAIVSHRFWQHHLGGDHDLSAKTLTFQGRAHTVVGVMPPDLDYPAGSDVWTPRELLPVLPSRTAHNWALIGRLEDGVTVEQARREMDGIAKRLREQLGDDTWMVGAAVVPLHEEMVGRVRPALLVLLGAAGFLLLIACANVTNLLLARATSRQREVAVRLALGAGRRRLIQQFLTEALVLAAGGGTVGLLLAVWGVSILLALEPGNLPRLAEIGVHPGVVAFAFGVSAAAAAALGLMVALHAANADVRESLAESQRTHAGSAAGNRLRAVLVASQMALTVVLLTGAGLLTRSFLRLLAVDPGFRTESAMTMSVSLPSPESEAEKARLVQLHDNLIARLRAIPGVDHIGGVNAFPLGGGGSDGTFLILRRADEVTDFESFRRLLDDPSRAGQADFRIASEGYFGAMNIPLIRGRLFEQSDNQAAPHVAVISQTLATRRWPNEDPIGKLIQFGNMDGDMRAFTIVGIVGDVRERGVDTEPRSAFYGYYRQRPGSAYRFTYMMHGAVDPAVLASSARGILRDLAPEVPPQFRAVEEVFSASLAGRRFSLVLLAVFGGAALLLAAMGIYGIMSYSVARRTHEIGVRMALGARSSDVIRLAVGGGLRLTVIGLAIGILAALATTRFLSSLLYSVSVVDPVTFAGVSLLLVAVALLASYLPARRATGVDPLLAMRSE